MATEQSVWQPDWAVPPGEILSEALQERGMSQSELARRMDRPVKTINEIVNGKAAITPDTAIQLERALGISARLWNGLETNYREHLARQRADRELADYAPWAKGFPFADLVRHGVVPATTTKGGRVAALLSFFRVSTPAAWNRQWQEPAVAFRRSPAFLSKQKALAAWLQWGEIAAEAVEAQPYDAVKFREIVAKVRTMTRREPFLQIIETVKEMCASAGVILVLTPELPGTHVSGATRWLAANRPMMQLSLRHKTDDQFWFSFFHEAAHILEGQQRDYLDEADTPPAGDEERLADEFARNTLIPPDDYEDFVARGDVSEGAVRAFAQKQGISAGIVVGRLHRDGKLDRSHLVPLKRPIQWPKPIR